MIIDVHTHIMPPGIRENRSRFAEKDRCFDLLYSNPKAKIATAQEVVDNMAQEGIDVSVVLNVGWDSHELCQITNDYILEAISTYPHKLVGFGAIQPLDQVNAVKEIERCARGGMRGIGELRCDTQGFDFADKDSMMPIIEVVREYDMIVLTHTSEPVGHIYPGKGAITPEIIYGFIQNFPDIKLVCAHWGGGLPFYALMPEVAELFTNVYFDTAASPFLYKNDIFTYVSSLVGKEKILFGSDYPLIKQQRIVEVVLSLDCPQDTKDMILGGNAQRLLSI